MRFIGGVLLGAMLALTPLGAQAAAPQVVDSALQQPAAIGELTQQLRSALEERCPVDGVDAYLVVIVALSADNPLPRFLAALEPLETEMSLCTPARRAVAQALAWGEIAMAATRTATSQTRLWGDGAALLIGGIGPPGGDGGPGYLGR